MSVSRVVKKILEIFLVFLSITFLSFCLIYLAPSDAAEVMLRQGGRLPSPEVIQALRERLGLDRNMVIQYLDWLYRVFRGDLGTSFSTGLPVAQSLFPAIYRTVQLAWRAFVATIVISIPTGVLCAKYQNRLFDKIVRIITYVLSAIPAFVIGVGALYFFAVKLRWLPAISNNSERGLVLPVTVMASMMSVWMIRQVRAIVAEKKNQSYVAGLRARGISELRIDFSYVLKDALIPILTSLGICFGSMLAGATIVENIFSWSGLGRSVLTAINARDFPMIQGFILWIAMIYYGINLILDAFYCLADPRIRKRGKA